MLTFACEAEKLGVDQAWSAEAWGMDAISPLAYLARYVLVTSLLFAAWSRLGLLYMDSVIPAVNSLATFTELPLTLEREGPHLLYRYRPPGATSFRLEAVDHGAVYLNLVTVLSLLSATSGRSALWHVRWAATACSLLWLTHVLSFFLGGQVAAWQFSATGPSAAALVAPLSASMGPDRVMWFHRALEIWGVWGRYGLCLGVWWLAALRPEPATSRATSPASSYPVPWAVRSTTG